MDHNISQVSEIEKRELSRPTSLLRFFVGIVVSSLILVLSGYALTTTSVMPPTFPLLVGLFLGILIYLITSGFEIPRRGNWRSLSLAAVLVIASLISALAYSTGSLAGAVSMPVLIIVAYLLSQVIPFGIFIHWFIGCLTVFSLIAIVANFLFVTLELPLLGSEVTNINGAVYANGLIVFLLVGWDGSPIERAMGPFWEPGLFASFLIIALIFEISYRREPARKWVIVLLVVGVLVARSTAGYLLMIPALALFLFKRRTALVQVLSVVTSILLLVVFASLGRIITWLISVDPELFGKLERDALIDSTRYNVFALNLSLFSESPIFGYGFSGANYEVVERMSGWGVAAQTSTTTLYMAALGIIGIVYTLGWFSILADSHLSVSERIIILSCILIILNKEPHASLLATTTILFYFLSRGESKKGYLEREVRQDASSSARQSLPQ